jgi:hypothetical protein
MFGASLIFGLFLSSGTKADRVVTLRNNCGSRVYFALTPGAAPNVHGSGAGCSSDGDCTDGAYCKTGGTNICFWKTPASIMNGGGFGLNQGESRQMIMPYLSGEAVWSGNIGACIQGGQCGSTDWNACNQHGCQASGATTLAEFTLLKHGVDFYDISIINGVAVPMEMRPDAQFWKYDGDAYTCKGAGTLQDGGNWNFNPPSNDYIWVTLESNPRGCGSNNDCGNGMICGVSRNPAGNIFKKTCGYKLGYWTQNQICGMNPNVGAPYNCLQHSTDTGSNLNLMQYLLCSNGIASCYANNPPADCCGCANWWEIGVPEVSSNTTRCKNQSNFWTQNVLPNLKFLKQGCPKCYTYPYDDQSSTFVCSNGNAGTGVLNTVSYTITFCPSFNALE